MAEQVLPSDIEEVRAGARCLSTKDEIEDALDHMASEITRKLGQTNPLLLAIMTGGIVPLAMLLPRLGFPLQVDYLHVTRYGKSTTGGKLRWVKKPSKAVRGRTVLLVDDLLDEGVTLATATAECRRLGAKNVLTAVLVTKNVKQRRGLRDTDFSGILLPDEYLFGYGMDYKTYLRNAPGIFAVKNGA